LILKMPFRKLKKKKRDFYTIFLKQKVHFSGLFWVSNF